MPPASGCTGSRWNAGAAPATVSEMSFAKPDTESARTHPAACGDARRATQEDRMRPFSIAGLAGLTALGAQAQSQVAFQPSAETVLVTATRAITPEATLRDVTLISREDIEAAGPISLGELLERRAGIGLRAVGGAGQPQSLFVRGAGSAQTLLVVDGMRVGSATVGTTAIENIPLELIERIEVVKGPMSSLYGSDAIGGVIPGFTRRKAGPNPFPNPGYG